MSDVHSSVFVMTRFVRSIFNFHKLFFGRILPTSRLVKFLPNVKQYGGAVGGSFSSHTKKVWGLNLLPGFARSPCDRVGSLWVIWL